MIDREMVIYLVGPLADWLEHGGDAEQEDLAYWERREKVQAHGGYGWGAAADLLGQLDVLLDSFNPDPDHLDVEVDEAELRVGVEEIITGLWELGLLR